MTGHFRFSPNENRADEIRWRPWGRDAFEEAAETETPILLHLTTVWCEACHDVDEDAFSDERVIRRINDDLIPIRVDADRQPHIQDRYIAGGWPTTALLAPTGEVFWSDTHVGAADLRRVIQGVLEAWRDRRQQLEGEIEGRRRAMEAARSQRPAHRLVRREAADDVLSGAQDQFDARNGGFGDGPKFIHAEGIELLFEQGAALPNPDWTGMAERTLDGMIAGDIEDPVEGGFFHYALEPDWTRPQVEKLLSVNARALSAFATGAALRPDREDWRAAAERTVAWVDTTLRTDSGLWANSQAADPAYFSADAGGRAELEPPPVDRTEHTDSSAMWIAALARAGHLLERDDWVDAASTALDTLLERMAGPDDDLVHFRAPDTEPAGEPPAGLLVDLLHAARAARSVAAAAGRDDALEEARRLVAVMRDTLWDERGGFTDYTARVEPLGALRFRDRPFEENALAARLHVDLARTTGDASYRAVAERVLAFLSPLAGRYGVEGATFAMAVEEFFELRKR